MSFARAVVSKNTWLLVVALLLSVFADGFEGTPARSAEITRERAGEAARAGFRIKRAEKCMMRKINQRRARHGLRRLNWDAQLIYVARKHSNSMAANRAVYHDGYIGDRVTNWRRLGQNTGGGNGCRSLVKAFMRSPKHRSNILGRWRYFGVGTERRNGRLYVQQIFESRVDPGNVYQYP